MDDAFLRWRREGTEAAFAALVAGVEGLVRRAARRQCPGDAALEDEVVQGAIWVLHRRGRTVRRPGALGAWLLTVTRNLARQLRREAEARRHHEQAGGDMLKNLKNDGGRDPWDGVRDRLDEALAAMPRRLREALVAQYLAGHSRSAAAASLGIGESAQKMRVQRGLAWLRTWFGGRGISVGSTALVAGLGLEGAEAAALVPTAGLASSAVTGGSAAARTLAAAMTRARLAKTALTWAAGLAATALVVLGGWRFLPGDQAGVDAPLPAVVTPDDPPADPPLPEGSGVTLHPHLVFNGRPADIRARVHPDGRMLALWNTPSREAFVCTVGTVGDKPVLSVLHRLRGAVHDLDFRGDLVYWIGGRARRVLRRRPLDQDGLEEWSLPAGAHALRAVAEDRVVVAAGDRLLALGLAAAGEVETTVLIAGAAGAGGPGEVLPSPGGGVSQLAGATGVFTEIPGRRPPRPPIPPCRGRQVVGVRGGIVSLCGRKGELEHLRRYAMAAGQEGVPEETRLSGGDAVGGSDDPRHALLAASRSGRFLVRMVANSRPGDQAAVIELWDLDAGVGAGPRRVELPAEGFRALPGGLTVDDGGRVAFVQRQEVWTWSAPVALRRRLAVPGLLSIWPTPHRDELLAVTRNGLVLVDLARDACKVLAGGNRPSCRPFQALALEESGRYLAAADGGGNLHLWDLVDLKRRAVIPAPTPVEGKVVDRVVRLAFDGADRRLAVAWGETVERRNRNWKIPNITGPDRLKARCVGLKQPTVFMTRWRIATWDLAAGTARQVVDPLETIWHWRWSFALNGRWAAGFDARGLRRFDLAAGRELKRLPLKALGPKDATTGKPRLPMIPGLKGKGIGAYVLPRLSLSPGGDRLLFESAGSAFIDLAAGAIDTTLPTNRLDDHAFNPRHPWLLGTDDARLYLIPLPEATPITNAPPAIDARWDPTGRRLLARSAEALSVLELPAALCRDGVAELSLEERKRLTRKISAVASFSDEILPDREVAGGAPPAQSGIARRPHHQDHLLLPGGRGLVIATAQGVSIHDLTTGAEVAVLYAFDGERWAIAGCDAALVPADAGTANAFTASRGGIRTGAAAEAVLRRDLAPLIGAAAAAWTPTVVPLTVAGGADDF